MRRWVDSCIGRRVVGTDDTEPGAGPKGGYSGNRGCYPANPASDADISFIRNSFLARYNTTLAKVSERHGAVFVDIQNRVVGHDACARDKWFEGFVPTSIYLGFHQNLKGNQAMARLIAEALPENLRAHRPEVGRDVTVPPVGLEPTLCRF